MKKLILLLIIYYSLIIANCFSQSITWQKWYDGTLHEDDAGWDICATTDGNFVVVGQTVKTLNVSGIFVIKINPYGDTIWTRIIDGYGSGQLAYSVASSPNGGCVLTGSADTAFIAKLNSSGDLVWYRRYGGRYVQLYNIIQTHDGGYIACGREINATVDGYVLKIDSAGNLQWQRLYPSLYLTYLQSIVEVINYGYVITGSISDVPYPQDTGKVLILRIDSVGNIIWSNRFKAIGTTVGLSIDKITAGYIIGGRSYNDSLDIPFRFFIKVGINGEVQNYKLFTSLHPNDVLTAFKVINNNRYAMASGYDTSIYPPQSAAHITIVDSLGNILIDKSIFNGDHDMFWAIFPNTNGDIFWVGQSRYSSPYWYDVYVVRSDSNVNIPPIGIINNKEIIPTYSEIEEIYPNPFNPLAHISFSIVKGLGNERQVKMVIYDVLGRKISTLLAQKLRPGKYKIDWNGTHYSSGVYFCSLYVDNILTSTKKLILIR